ncbi:MAG: DUF3090 family protein [Ktedonobacteraceae bacterium]|nr:DUF3090 family protein [Ktedonobacteraceae bacterium]MBV9712046.1 DUF3090 family protein [Ktedonobacteraceae bacterium]
MSIELGPVWLLGADAVGRPGQRRFRLFVQSARGSAILWMEKEQLNSLSLSLDRVLAHLTEGQVLRVEAQVGERAQPGKMPPDFPRTPTYEFQVGQMNLGYDEDRDIFLLAMTPLEIEMEPGQEPQVVLREDEEVSFLFSQEDARELSISISAVVSAGRPVCPLCHTPLDGGPHACVKQNGHREILQIEEEEEEDE